MLNIAQLPRVGVGVLIFRNNKILLSKRLKEYGYGQLALPGGHVEWQETLIDCAKREVLEETGLQLKRVVNTQMYTEEISEGKHYVTFYLIAKCPKNQDPQQTEPTKHEPWNWYDPWKLPNHTWAPTKRLMKRIKEKLEEEQEDRASLL
jgi:8-oxo-dGTP diphosphatase